MLSTLLVEQVANRNLDGKKKLKLDPRSCPTMAKDLHKSAACATENACEAAWPEVEVYRERCESDEHLPDVTTAVAQLSIAVGARQEPTLTLVSLESDSVAPGSVPLALADGTGAILGLCHKHPVKTDDYLATSKRCVGTELTVARLSQSSKGSDQGAVQVAKLNIPRMPISGPYPWLAVADEAAARAAVGTAELKKDLTAVLAAPAGEAVAKLVQLAHNHGRWITESADAQAVMKAKDDELAPLLVKLAEIKVAGAKAITDSAKLRGLHHRAMKRPFADVRRDGKFVLGAATAAFWVDAHKALPKAMKKYQQALEPLSQQVGGAGEPTAKQKRSAREGAAKRARSCRAKLAARRKLEAELEKCAFQSCDEAKVLGLVASWSDAHTAAQNELRQVDLALSPVGQNALSESLTKEQGCDVTPW